MSELITLTSDSNSIQHLCKDKRMAKLISILGPISYTLSKDSYSFLVNTIIGQMLSNKVADILSSRLITLCGDFVCPDTIGSLTDEAIQNIGISKSKVSYIRNLTEAIQSGTISFSEFPHLQDGEIIKKLTSLRGIGNWSAKMYLIFALDRQDVLPVEDAAFLQGYSWLYNTADLKPASLATACEGWKPYSSIAARYLYQAVDKGLTKEVFYL